MVHVRPSMRHGRFVGSAQSGLRSLHVHALATRPELLLSAGPVHCGERRSVLCAFSQRAGSASAQPTQREPQPSSSPGALPSQLHSGIAGSTSPEKSCVIQTVPSLFHAKPQNAAPNAGSRIAVVQVLLDAVVGDDLRGVIERPTTARAARVLPTLALHGA
eukprot:2281985-Pleurochrysis_carterae.AAC.5